MQGQSSNARSVWSRYVDAIADHPAVTLGCAAALFCALGWWQDGINLDSTTYSVIARNMAEHGGPFNPTYTAYHHTHFAEHPPLVLWAQAAIFWLFGATDSTARLFGQLCTIGSVVAAYGLTREALGKRFGIIAGLVLLLTYNFMEIGNSTLLDVPMSFFVLAALWGLTEMQKAEVGKPPPVGATIATGLDLAFAFLCKGVVAGPVFLAVFAAVFFIRRDWLRQLRFWLLPVAMLVPIGLFLIGDLLSANGHFARYYFMVQVWQRFLGGGPEIHTAWYEFLWRLFKLYQPWVLVLPFGIYLVFRRRTAMLYPAVVTLLAYVVFYSTAAKLYYHYFSPVYALGAPLVAVAVGSILRETHVRRTLAVFVILWVAAGVGVTVAGVRIHHIRMKAVYELTSPMALVLDRQSSRDGLMVREGQPQWDIVAKTSWYWRSDLLTVPDLSTAIDSMHASDRYNYILMEPPTCPDDLRWGQLGLRRYARMGGLTVLVPADSTAP